MPNFAFTSSNQNPQLGGSEFLWTETCLQLAEEGHGTGALIGEQYNAGVEKRLRAAGVKVVRDHHALPNLGQRISNRFLPTRMHRRPPVISNGWFDEVKQSGTPLIISMSGWGDGLARYLPFARAGHPIALIVQLTVDHFFPRDEVATKNREVLTAATRVYCVSQRAIDDMRRGYALPLPNARFVWNPMKTPAPEVCPPAPSGIPGKDRPLRLACVARSDITAKGQDLLLRALASRQLADAAIEITFAGDGMHHDTLQKMAAYLKVEDKVHFAGHVSDLAQIWADHDAGVFSSRCEGLPNALLEAMSHGRPSIVTDVGGNAEVTRDGIDGWVCPQPSVPDLIQGLERCLADGERMGKMGMEARTAITEKMPAEPVTEFANQLLADFS